MMKNPVVVLTLGNMRGIGERIAKRLVTRDATGFVYAEVETIRFANGEIKTTIPVTLRHCDVYLLASLQDPDPNIALMQLLIAADSIRRASAESLTLVLPYLCYSRQDRKAAPREPITARLVADMIE